MSVIVSIVIGYVLDMIIGTPKFLKKIKGVFVRALKWAYSKINGKAAIPFTLLILAVGGGISYGLIHFINAYNSIAAIAVESILCYLCISCKEIKDSSERVHKALKRGYIKRATKLFNTLTDNGEINEPKEIAENIIIMIMDGSVDKVVAPIFYIIIFGSTGGIVYKLAVIINGATGRLFVRVIKNLADFIPTRVFALFLIIAAKILSLDCKNAFKIFKRDRYKAKSLNRGFVMSLCAGAAGCQFNIKKSDIVVGDNNNDVNYNHIKKIFELINIGSLLMLVVLAVIRIIIVLFTF